MDTRTSALVPLPGLESTPRVPPSISAFSLLIELQRQLYQAYDAQLRYVDAMQSPSARPARARDRGTREAPPRPFEADLRVELPPAPVDLHASLGRCSIGSRRFRQGFSYSS